MITIASIIYVILLIFIAAKKGPHILSFGAALLSVPESMWMALRGDFEAAGIVAAIGIAALACGYSYKRIMETIKVG
jgi:hypothetical protein